MKLAIWFALVVAVVAIGPILTIKALNILFGLGIDVNLYTWLATFWLQILFVAPKNISK